jgi:hypothetical protein
MPGRRLTSDKPLFSKASSLTGDIRGDWVPHIRSPLVLAQPLMVTWRKRASEVQVRNRTSQTRAGFTQCTRFSSSGESIAQGQEPHSPRRRGFGLRRRRSFLAASDADCSDLEGLLPLRETSSVSRSATRQCSLGRRCSPQRAGLNQRSSTR